uniref:BPI2 domain-containing protein n=1 Tax=Panagrellus redivivus TaxID=6233 RepID=A0A7E4UQL1_PANRE
MVALDNGAKKSVLDIGLICIESFGELIKDDPDQHFTHLDVLGKQLVEIAYEKNPFNILWFQVMQVLPAGLILIKSDGGETIDFKATISSLPILEDIDEPVDSDIIRLDTDVLHTFFSSLPEDVPRFSIRVTDIGQILLSAKFTVLDFAIYMRTLRELIA